VRGPSGPGLTLVGRADREDHPVDLTDPPGRNPVMTQSPIQPTGRRRRLTYANIVSTLALVLVIGGGGAAVAAGLAKNSVGSPQIKNGAVKAIDIQLGAVRGPKVLDDSLTGADLDESTLGQVPSAASADSATTATTAGSADVAGRATNVHRVTVSAAGLVTASSGGISANKISPGVYNVIFSPAVTTCSYVGAISRVGAGLDLDGIVKFASLAGNPNGVFVSTKDLAGAAADRGFALAVIC
jgi:hypothetical protein